MSLCGRVVQARRNEEKERQRKQAVAAKDAFLAMLEENDELKASDTFTRAKELFQHDARWKVGHRHFITMVLLTY